MAISQFQLEWDRIKEGIGHIEEIFKRFRDRLFGYLQSLI